MIENVEWILTNLAHPLDSCLPTKDYTWKLIFDVIAIRKKTIYGASNDRLLNYCQSCKNIIIL